MGLSRTWELPQNGWRPLGFLGQKKPKQGLPQKRHAQAEALISCHDVRTKQAHMQLLKPGIQLYVEVAQSRLMLSALLASKATTPLA